MGKKSSRAPASKTASAAQPAASAATVMGKKSSILRAAFSPSEYQLALFASVIQGLDSQHLRIHDIHTGALQCEHSVAPKESITSLDWGYLGGQRDQGSKKKRKRKSDANGAGEDKSAVVAFGTSSSDVRVYSPAEDKVLYTLSGVHEGGIKDFKFTFGESAYQGWSVGGDNRLVQWDLVSRQSIRIINVPTTSTISALSRPIPSNPPVICATQTPIILDVENSDAESLTFPSLTTPIHTLISSSTTSIKDANFIAADNERYITVFDPKTQGIAYNLVAEQEVSSLSLSTATSVEGGEESLSGKQVLAAVVENGTIELFNKPFSQFAGQNGAKATSQKARAKQMIRKADAILKIVRPDTGKAVSAVQVGFQGSELYVAWAEGGVNVIFERVKWQDQDTGDLVFSGATEITGRKSTSVLKSAAVIEERQASKSHVNEHNAVVDSGLYSGDVEMNDAHDDDDDAVSISDAEEASDLEDETTTTKKRQPKKVNGVNGNSKNAGMEIEEDNQDEEEEEGEAGGELTFGELVQRNSAIDVEAELEDNAGAGASVPGLSNSTSQAVAQIPSGVSLSTVLSQALKTNDSEMLESCFRTSDINIIRSTVQRLNSAQAGALIQRLAERMASRPGRYGHLLVWVQWTCIAHGGAIAGNAEILKRMTSLYKVMDQRSRSLPSLLLLKGKLDMLDAQINLRQSMADSRKHVMGDDQLLDNVTHYAGVGNDDSEAERRRKRKKTLSNAKSSKSTAAAGLDDDGEVDEDDQMADDLGLASDSDEEEGSEEDAYEDGDMIDIEAEESLNGDDDDDDDDDEEDDEEDEDEDSDAASDMGDFIVDSEEEDEFSDSEKKASAPPPSKKSKKNKS